MKRSLNIRLLLCFLLCASLPVSVYALGNSQGKVSVIPEKPWVNDKVIVRYNAVGSDLEYSDEVKAVCYILNDFKWKVEELLMSEKDGQWEAELNLSAESSFVALKFIQGELYQPDISDNNDEKGYFFTVLNASGKPQPGNAIGQAMLLAPSAAGGLLNTYYTANPTPQPEQLKKLLREEEKISGSDRMDYLGAYLKLQQIILGPGFDTFSRNFLGKELSRKELSEQNLANLYNVYSHTLRDTILGPQIGDRILEAYPRSNTARLVSYGRVYSLKGDVHKNVAAIEGFMKQFPYGEWRKNPDGRDYIYYSLFRVLGSSYFETKQFDKFVNLYEKNIDFKTGNELARWNILRAYKFNFLGKDTLYQVARQVMSYLLRNKNDLSYRSDFNSTDAARNNAIKQLDERLATHISLLNDLGKYDEARKFFFELSEVGRYASAELNEINLQVLEGLKLQNEVLPHLEMSVKYNAITPGMIDKLKEIYRSKHANKEDGFDEYLTSLKSDESKAELREYVQSNMVNHPMPAFELETADGSTVSSEELKDKIIVMDFWATWCQPCLKALPGMQLVADKFAQDPQVRVYLVGTMQTGDYKEKSVNFIRRSGYRFHMLHDAVNPATKQQDQLFRQLAPFFNSSGIPRKIIVKNGIIRYSSEGYSGSPSKLLDEIALAIELLKNEN